MFDIQVQCRQLAAIRSPPQQLAGDAEQEVWQAVLDAQAHAPEQAKDLEQRGEVSALDALRVEAEQGQRGHGQGQVLQVGRNGVRE